MSLNIAVVGYNYELSCRAIRLIAENDINAEIKIARKNEILMNDETKYKAFPTYNHVRGHCIYQIIIVDDSRWNVYEHQDELIEWLKYRLDYTSYVPEEFQIQRYKMVR